MCDNNENNFYNVMKGAPKEHQAQGHALARSGPDSTVDNCKIILFNGFYE